MNNEQMPHQSSGVTRRGFIDLAIGALTILPSVAGGFLVPQVAMADEQDEEDGGEYRETATVYALKAYEVGFVVCDMADGGKTKLAGAYVKVTSRYNHKTVDGHTNSDGVAILDISTLAENYKGLDVKKLDSYGFNATIEVTKDGYREFMISRTRVTGSLGLLVPTRKRTSTMPYPYLAAFDEWDALYTVTEFACTKGNDEEHDLRLEFRDVGNAAVTIAIKVVGEQKARLSQKVTPQNGAASVTFTGKFLQKGDSAAFPIDKKILAIIVDRGKTYNTTLSLGILAGAVDAPEDHEDVDLEPMDTGDNSLGFKITWPDWVPLVGGQEFEPWFPDFPVAVNFDPFGYIQVTVKIAKREFKKDFADPNNPDTNSNEGWKKFPRDSFKQQYEDLQKDMNRMIESYNSANSSTKKIKSMKSFHTFEWSATLQLVGRAQWDLDDGIFQGMLAAQILLQASYTYAKHFLIGPVPIMIVFNVEGSATFGLSLGCYSTREENPSKSLFLAAVNPTMWHWDRTNTGFTLNLSVTPSLTAGVGLHGVASLAIKGSLTLGLYFGHKLPGDHSDNSWYHFILGAGWKAEAVVHMFLFTATKTIGEHEYAPFFDNWKGGWLGLAEAADPLAAMADESLYDLLQSMDIVTDEMLSTTSEQRGTVRLVAQSDEEYVPPIEMVKSGEYEAATDDGQVITYTVFDLTPGGKSDETQDGDTKEEGLKAQSDDAADKAADNETISIGEVDETASTDEEQSIGNDAENVSVGDAEPDLTAQSIALEAQGVADNAALIVDGTSEPAIFEATAAGIAAAADVSSEAPITVDDTSLESIESAEDGITAEDGIVADGEEPALKAQGEESGTHMVERVVYEPIRRNGLSALADSDGLPVVPPIGTIGRRGGVAVPSTLLANDVYGDPRIKVFEVSYEVSKHKSTAFGLIEWDKLSGSVHLVCSFRIGTVETNNVTRTRILMDIIDARCTGDQVVSVSDLKALIGTQKVVEFNTPGDMVLRKNLYDYDFDVVATKDTWDTNDGNWFNDNISNGERIMLNFVIVSGTRAAGNGTNIANVATDLYFTYSCMDLNDLVSGNPASYSVTKPAHAILGDDERYHFISNLRCQVEWTEDLKDRDADGVAIVMAYLDRVADTPDGTLSEDPAVIDTKVSLLVVGRVGDKLQWVNPRREDLDARFGTIQDGAIYELELLPKIQGKYTISLTAIDRTYVYVADFETTVEKKSKNEIETRFVIHDIKPARVLEDKLGLVPWIANDCFLFSYPKEEYRPTMSDDPKEWDRTQWCLHKGWWAEENGEFVLECEQIGPESFNFTHFGINGPGTFIFWSQGRDDDESRVYDAAGEDYEENDRTPLYQLMACRIHNEVFSDPFVVGEVGHDMNNITIIDTSVKDSPMQLLSTERIASGQKTKEGTNLYYAANLWYTSVPNLANITVIGCSSVSTFVIPGSTAKFDVLLRNNGNSYLSDCVVQMCVHDVEIEEDGAPKKDENGNIIDRGAKAVANASVKLEFSEDTLLESTWNPADKDGNIQNVEPDYALAPGKRSLYRIEVPIPKDWEHAKVVSFIADQPTIAQGGGLNGQADEDLNYQTFVLEPGTYKVLETRTEITQDPNRTYMDVIEVGPSPYATALQDAPMRVGDGSNLVDDRPASEPGNSDNTSDDGGNGNDNANQNNGGQSGAAAPQAGTGGTVVHHVDATGGSSGATSGSKTATPKTADSSMSPLPAVAAAAGAAVLAYEARRARNEKADEEE